MFRILFAALVLPLVLPWSGWAQDPCNINSKIGRATCSDTGLWEQSIYNCCHQGPVEGPVCDPCCCETGYFSAFGGGVFVENFHRQMRIPPIATTLETQGPDVLDGYGAGIAAGVRVHPQLRLEAEYTYRYNVLGDWFTGVETSGALTSLTRDPADGHVRTNSLMFNSLYDVSRPRIQCPNLYGGGGIGVLHADSTIDIPATTYEISDAVFAWQLIGGVNYPLSNRMELFTEYRYTGADAINVVDAGTGLPWGDFGYDSHNVFAGIRFYR